MNSEASPPSQTNWPVNILAATLFLVPAVGMPNEYMLQDTLKSAIAAFGILLAGLGVLWDRYRYPRPLRWHWILILPGSLCLYAFGSMVWSHSYLAGVEAIRWGLLGLLLLVCHNSLGRFTIDRILWWLHWGAVVAAVWVCLQFWFGLQWFPQVAPPASTFANRNFYAEYAVTVLPFSLVLMYRVQDIRLAVVVSLSAALCVAALLMTGTRSALLTLVVVSALIGLTLLCVARQRSSWKVHSVRWLVPPLALTLGCVVLVNIPRFQVQPTLQSDSVTPFQFAFARAKSLARPQEYSQGSFATRAFYWRSTMRMLQQHPWSGVGAGAWEVEIPQYEGTDNSVEADYYAHNDFLQLLSEYGLIVGLLWIALFLAYLVQTWRSLICTRKIVDPDQFLLRGGAATSAVAATLVSGAGFPLHLAGVGMLVMVALAMLVLTQPHQTKMFGPSVRHSMIPPKLFPVLAMVGGALLAMSLLTSILAYRSESYLVRAVNWANSTITARSTPTPIELTQLVQWIDNGLEINPHQRKLASPAADALVAFGDYENAARILDVLAASRPHVADIWANLVLIRANLGDYVRAQTALAQLKRLQPQHSRTQRLDILLLYRQGAKLQAKKQLLAYLNAPDAAFELFNFAYSMGVEIGDQSIATTAISLRTARWPSTAPDGYFKMGLFYANAQTRDNDQALKAFQQGLELVPLVQHSTYLNAVPEPFRSHLH